MIDVYLLRALALQKKSAGRTRPQALELFERALTLAEPEGYVLLFVEEGPAVLTLLQAVAGGELQPNQLGVPERLKKYAQNLLAAFPGGPPTATPALPAAAVHSELAEPLSARELEVLRLLADGLTYAEIARRLAVSLNTTRFHVKSIYSKLGVAKRAAAINRARELKLI